MGVTRSLRWLYAHASSFVLRSLLEGFGLPAAEAIARDLVPCQSCASGGLPIRKIWHVFLYNFRIDGWRSLYCQFAFHRGLGGDGGTKPSGLRSGPGRTPDGSAAPAPRVGTKLNAVTFVK